MVRRDHKGHVCTPNFLLFGISTTIGSCILAFLFEEAVLIISIDLTPDGFTLLLASLTLIIGYRSIILAAHKYLSLPEVR